MPRYQADIEPWLQDAAGALHPYTRVAPIPRPHPALCPSLVAIPPERLSRPCPLAGPRGGRERRRRLDPRAD